MLKLKCVARNNNYYQQVSCFSHQRPRSKLYHPISVSVSWHLFVQPPCSNRDLSWECQTEVALLPNSTHKYFHQAPIDSSKLQNGALPFFSFFSLHTKYNSPYYILSICSVLPSKYKAQQNICSSSSRPFRSGKDCCFWLAAEHPPATTKSQRSKQLRSACSLHLPRGPAILCNSLVQTHDPRPAH